MKRVYRFANAALPRPENLRVLRALFTAPDALRPDRTPEGVTEEAAQRFARLADGMRARGVAPREAARFKGRFGGRKGPLLQLASQKAANCLRSER